MVYNWNSNHPDETAAFAYKLGELLEAGDVLTLEGDLGAGKTAFSKGIAKGLGVTRNVNSPTFTIMKEYKGRLPLYHMDVYRLGDEGEDLGFEEYFEGEGVCLIEWAHLIEEQLPAERLQISIFHEGENDRRFEFRPIGERYGELCKEILS
ncbi:tRNA (adenosine(37)-N6)-threonylcarbamoyltransferase complex ATPase subunit type 1 TsaE [Jeotgalibacillus proteolyticus]|uniref:tRNA threonylcarbamoyladenosine biosynthesis protein TsaE n=1 Tax=Jeotgalibacillus proteolyticus TaxID=2082395 RepID=A0A2S5G684_9BACL|nr:tRNA (adenosine(37)-N6)-threonylcarbamoyltransferase complex ATPase subunit type 1 TsaE [Jeotgalibacillus proteolyticus]PPA68453.1 tRNA (adenosine(37)-N6)-threonylcarbamoyltransferase complex ATPase subunit type 1 TsaE [Jeotgalibacillus proteolyticus]